MFLFETNVVRDFFVGHHLSRTHLYDIVDLSGSRCRGSLGESSLTRQCTLASRPCCSSIDWVGRVTSIDGLVDSGYEEIGWKKLEEKKILVQL